MWSIDYKKYLYSRTQINVPNSIKKSSTIKNHEWITRSGPVLLFSIKNSKMRGWTIRTRHILYNRCCCVIKYANFILASACESEEQRSIQLWKCEGRIGNVFASKRIKWTSTSRCGSTLFRFSNSFDVFEINYWMHTQPHHYIQAAHFFILYTDWGEYTIYSGLYNVKRYWFWIIWTSEAIKQNLFLLFNSKDIVYLY